MAAQANASKHAFLNMPAPASYVAGLGRGASGFTTRSDIGPARAVARNDGAEEQEANPEQYQDPENETGLFAGTTYERDDEEADKVWEGVDRHMDDRRRKRREARERAEMEAARAERPKIQAQFADLKRGLGSLGEDDWASIPEAGNLTGKRRKAAAAREARDNRTYAVPDSVLLSAKDRNATEASLSEEQMEDGTQSTIDANGTTTSLTEIGEARNKIFSHKLDQVSAGTSSVIGGTSSSIDPTGYLTSLSSLNGKTAAEIGDLKKARSLLDSVIKTNPKHAPGWIAAARLEEMAGKMALARKVMAQGCEQCPKSEDAWLESARLNTNENAKVILARAVQHLSQSVKIWLKATELESDPESKKRVLRKSLEYIPTSVKLWKELVSLEESPEDARILLSGAVGATPTSVELWLALARLSTPDEAQKVLNVARKSIPTSHEIWIAAARLLEQGSMDESQTEKVDKVIARAVKSLATAGAVLNREQWLKEAERVEREGSPITCAAIIKATIHFDVEERDQSTVWVEDAEASLERGCIDTARAILAYTLRVYPDEEHIWRLAANVEKQHGTRESLEAILERAVTACPKAEVLWLMYAKEKWVGDRDVPGARQVLIRAFDHNMGSEQISLAAAKLEAENGEKEAASLLLGRAREEVGTARVWIKSATFERNEGKLTRALELVVEALSKFPSVDKLHMMHAQLLEATEPKEDNEHLKAARVALAKGVKACPHSIPLWLMSSRLEEKAGIAIRARALLEKARLANPRNDELWAESAAVEERSGSPAQAKSMIARGLQDCPSSGLLWTASIWSEPKAARKTRSADALKRSGDDVLVICTVARLFWNDRKIEQARKWFDRATKARPDWGDGWAWWAKFERQHGTPQTVESVVARCEKADPHHGHHWQVTLKDPAYPHRTTREVLEACEAALTVVY